MSTIKKLYISLLLVFSCLATTQISLGSFDEKALGDGSGSSEKKVYVLLHDANWNCLIARKRFIYRAFSSRQGGNTFAYLNQAGQWLLPGGNIKDESVK